MIDHSSKVLHIIVYNLHLDGLFLLSSWQFTFIFNKTTHVLEFFLDIFEGGYIDSCDITNTDTKMLVRLKDNSEVKIKLG